MGRHFFLKRLIGQQTESGVFVQRLRDSAYGSVPSGSQARWAQRRRHTKADDDNSSGLSDAPFVEKMQVRRCPIWPESERDRWGFSGDETSRPCMCWRGIYIRMFAATKKKKKETSPYSHPFLPSRQHAQQDRCGCLEGKKKGRQMLHFLVHFSPFNQKKKINTKEIYTQRRKKEQNSIINCVARKMLQRRPIVRYVYIRPVPLDAIDKCPHR